LITNEKVPNYLDQDAELEAELDFWKKTQCYLVAGEEIKGYLFIKKDTLMF
jgi:hypothetical protein